VEDGGALVEVGSAVELVGGASEDVVGRLLGALLELDGGWSEEDDDGTKVLVTLAEALLDGLPLLETTDVGE
jgi:hypothetical protein